MNILHLFDINSTFFTIWSYPMSYIEFFGTIITIWGVWLTAKAKVLSWPVGLVGVVLYLILFYQIRLYSDMFEQAYFFITGIIGWWAWLHPKTKEQSNTNDELKVSYSSKKQNLTYATVIFAGTFALTYLVKNLNIWLPAYFPEPAAYPFLDAFTTVMSFMAQWLLVNKKIENWILWVIIDAIAIGLYWSKGVKFISIEYLLFFFIASYGLVSWIKEFKLQSHDKQSQL